jgi:glycosyltransferase involved in cell wall biosynthesis
VSSSGLVRRNRVGPDVADNPLRIWFVNHYAVPPAQPGGTRHHHLAAELMARGHEVLVIASSFNHSARAEMQSAPDAVVSDANGVPFHWIRTPPYTGNGLSRVWNMMSFATSIWRPQHLHALPRPDVIVGSSPHLFGALAAERLAKAMNVPFVLEVRDIWPESLITIAGVHRWHPLVLVLSAIERYLYRRSARVVSLLPGAASHIASRGGHESRVTWIPNGIDLGLVENAGTRHSTNLKFTVMYAGAHGQANALDSILQAASILEREGWADRIRFRLVGAGPEKQRLQDEAAKLGISNISFEPPVPKVHVHRRLAEADAFIVTMRNTDLYRHGISFNKLFDYLAVGRPIIFGANSANNPVADAGAGITVAPEDARAMAEAIKQIACMEATERAEIGERGRRFVEAHHSFHRLAARMETALAAAVTESRK